MSAEDVRIERGGWMANHPITGHPTHVVTREWFDEKLSDIARLEARIAEVERERDEAVEIALRVNELAENKARKRWQSANTGALEAAEARIAEVERERDAIHEEGDEQEALCGGGSVSVPRIYVPPLICWCGKSYKTWVGFLRCMERHQRGKSPDGR